MNHRVVIIIFQIVFVFATFSASLRWNAVDDGYVIVVVFVFVLIGGDGWNSASAGEMTMLNGGDGRMMIGDG